MRNCNNINGFLCDIDKIVKVMIQKQKLNS